MFTVLATRLALTISGSDTTDLEYSQPVSLQGANAVNFDFTVYSFSGTSVTVTAQFGNDLENWTDGPTPIAATAPGYFGNGVGVGGTFENSSGFQYARLEYKLDGADADYAILASGMTTSNQ